MIESNVVPFKKRRYPKKKGLKIISDDFEQFVSEVRKSKLKGFVAIAWLDDEVAAFSNFGNPIDFNSVIGELEAFKTYWCMKYFEFKEENE
jgi:hypothetical protein